MFLSSFGLQTISVLLRFSQRFLGESCDGGSTNENSPVGLFSFVLPPGIEPGVPIPQTGVLSVKLWERCGAIISYERLVVICFCSC
jgi:hypothetical protein